MLSAGCVGSEGGESSQEDSSSQEELTPLNYMMINGEADIPIWLSQQDAWAEQEIDIDPELTTYDRYSRALYSGGELNIGNINLSILNQGYLDGEDLVVFAGNELETNGVWTRSDSDIEGIDDLDEDTRLGVPFWNSGTTNFARGMIMEEHGLDIREDTDSTSAEPPVLWELLTEQEDLDAIVEFTGFAYKGLANPDIVDRIYSPEEFVRNEFGEDPFVTMFASRRDWIEQPENAQLALDFLEGWDLANERFKQNLSENMEQYGRFAGLDSEAEIDLIRELYADNQITRASDTWDDNYIETQIGILDILEKHDLVEEAAPREQGITHTELKEIAGE
jgi:hypothetical protein